MKKVSSESFVKDIRSVLQDKIVIETIKSWQEYFDPVAYICNEALGGITISEINYRDLEYLLKNVGRTLSPDLTDMYYLIECSNGLGLTHKKPINAPGRPKLELDMDAKDPHPFVCLWSKTKIAIESNTMTIVLSSDLQNTSYQYLSGKEVHLPLDKNHWPSPKALDQHRKEALL